MKLAASRTELVLTDRPRVLLHAWSRPICWHLGSWCLPNPQELMLLLVLLHDQSSAAP